MIEELVILKDKQAVTTSLQVAKSFEKRHDHVLRDIDKFKKDVPNFGEMFVEGIEPDSYGRDRRIYYMNRDGFTLLAMGFNGKKALNFKLAYIEAFNKMEEHIKDMERPKIDISDQMLKLAEINKIQSETNNKQIDALIKLKSYQDSNTKTNININYYNSDLIRIGDFAKIFSNRHGVNLSQVRLFRYLRKRHILVDKKYLKKKVKNDKYNTPEIKYSRHGYFEVVETQKGNNVYKVTLLTLKGQEWLDQLIGDNLSKVLSPNL